MRIAVRAKPGARADAVIRDDNADAGPTLIVRVRARAVDGAANQAVVAAVAEALDVRPRQVTLHRGARSRSKVLEVDAPEDLLLARLAALPGTDGPAGPGPSQ